MATGSQYHARAGNLARMADASTPWFLAESRCPGCGRTVECSATAPIQIEFDPAPNRGYIGWATGASIEPFAGDITINIEDEAGEDVDSAVQDFPKAINILGMRIAVVHECSYGGEAHDRAKSPTAPPQRAGTVEIDLPSET